MATTSGATRGGITEWSCDFGRGKRGFGSATTIGYNPDGRPTMDSTVRGGTAGTDVGKGRLPSLLEGGDIGIMSLRSVSRGVVVVTPPE